VVPSSAELVAALPRESRDATGRHSGDIELGWVLPDRFHVFVTLSTVEYLLVTMSRCGLSTTTIETATEKVWGYKTGFR
jgi:hypothetical protein